MIGKIITFFIIILILVFGVYFYLNYNNINSNNTIENEFVENTPVYTIDYSSLGGPSDDEGYVVPTSFISE